MAAKLNSFQLALGRAGIVSLGLGAGAVAADVDWGASLSVGGGYVDNLELAADGLPSTSSTAAILAPELSLSVDQQWFRGELVYRLEHYEFLDESDFNSTIQLGAANGTLIVVPDLFNVELNANRYQQLLQPERPVNIENFFSSGNNVDTVSWAVAPILSRRIGSTTAQARYEISSVQFDLPPLVGPLPAFPDRPEDSDLRRLSASWGTSENESRTPWFVRYNSDRVEYDIALPYRYDAARVGAAYEFSPTLLVGLEVGRESDLTVDSTSGGMNSDVGLVRARWRPGSRTEAEFSVGRRFFGTTYGVRLSREAKLLRLDASYSEEPTTVGEQAQRFAPIGPDALAPGQPRQDQQRLGSRAFVLKAGAIQASIDGRRTNMRLRAYSDRRDYFEVDATEDYYGADLDITRRLSPGTAIQFNAGWVRSNFIGGGNRRDTRLGTSLTRQMSDSLTGAIELGHYDSTLFPNIQLESWFGFLRLTYEFASPSKDAPRRR